MVVAEMGLNHTRLVGVVLLGTIALNIWLYISIPKTFFRSRTLAY